MSFLKLAALWIFLATSTQAAPIGTYNGVVERWDISKASPGLTYFIDPAIGATYTTYAGDGFTVWQAVPESYVTFSVAASADVADIYVKGYNAISNSAVP